MISKEPNIHGPLHTTLLDTIASDSAPLAPTPRRDVPIPGDLWSSPDRAPLDAGDDAPTPQNRRLLHNSHSATLEMLPFPYHRADHKTNLGSYIRYNVGMTSFTPFSCS